GPSSLAPLRWKPSLPAAAAVGRVSNLPRPASAIPIAYVKVHWEIMRAFVRGLKREFACIDGGRKGSDAQHKCSLVNISPQQRGARMQLFRHARCAQSMIEAYAQLLVRQAGKHERNWRTRAECRHSRAGASFQIGGERGASLLGATQERVGRREESV